MFSNSIQRRRLSWLHHAITVGLVLIAICGQSVAGIRLTLEPNTRVAQSSAAVQAANARMSGYVKSSVFRLGDGVVPRGTASFVLGDRPDGKPITADKITIQIAKPKQLFNDSIEYDSFRVVYDNDTYDLDTDDEVFCRLVSFVKRGKHLLFTFPFADDEEALRLFKEEGLVKSSRSILGRFQYIAKEFDESEYYDFLMWVDVHSETKRLPYNAKSRIVDSLNKNPISVDAQLEWINADFHVDYLVMLLSENGKRRVDIAGAPLRYYWRKTTENTLSVKDIKVFDLHPDLKKEDLQYRAIALFQAAALLRQFKSDNPFAFSAVAKQIEDLQKLPKTAQ